MAKLSHILSIAALASLALTSTAFAHAHLKSSVPADKATVKVAPTKLDLTFSEELNLKFTGVKIMGQGKTEVKTGTTMLMDVDKGMMCRYRRTSMPALIPLNGMPCRPTDTRPMANMPSPLPHDRT